MSKIKFLVVDDEPEIREFNGLMLLSAFDAEILYAEGGDPAIEILKSHNNDFNCIVCDYKMKLGNADVLHSYLLEHAPKLPFLLVTSSFYQDHKNLLARSNEGYLQKPYDGAQLINSVKKLISTQNVEEKSSNSDYVPVSYQIIFKMSSTPGALYVKIGDDRFKKVVHENEQILYNELIKYEQKGAQYLYVLRQDWPLFIQGFIELVNSIMVLEKLRAEPIETLKLSNEVQEIVHTTIRNFGWTPEAQQAAQRNIQIVRKLIQAKTHLRQFESMFHNPDQHQSLIHSVLFSYLMNIAYMDSAFINGPRELEILTIAAFFHDASLDDHQIRNETQLVKSVMLNIGASKQDRLMTEEHPEKIVRILEKWEGCPEDLLQILFQHHERPDGKGFPRGLDRSKISKLAHAFICTHELAEIYIHCKDLNKTLVEYEKLQDLYKHSTFDFYEANLNLVKTALEKN